MCEDDALLVETISAYARAETVAAARRLAAIAELAVRRLGSELARARELQAVDGWDSCAAEVAAELTIGHRSASGLMHQGLDLRYRLPRLGALFLRGEITLKVATTASWRTKLILDDDLLAKVDDGLADIATRCSGYSDDRLNDAIDTIVQQHDPDAVRRFRAAERGLDMRFGKPGDETGTVSVYGRVKSTDAELANRRMEAMATSVCPNDPRTHGERRTEAFGIINAGGDHMPCLCGRPECPASEGPDARGKYFDILVITNDPDAGKEPAGADGPEAVADEPKSPSSGSAPCPFTSLIAGGGTIPAPLLAELRRIGAAARPVVTPQHLNAETGYRPSTALQRFVRARDMTCCFPGCTHPAEYCDVDHTVPYEQSRLTHPGNVKALCRKHHLLKTFWVGRGGWTDEQLADGTVVWTTPAGLRKVVPPRSRLPFPEWDTATPVPDGPVPAARPAPGRELRMPTRSRTRAQSHRDRVNAERERNRRLDAENPPPF